MRAIAYLVVLCFSTVLAVAVNAKPFVPDEDAMVLETLPIRPLDPRYRELRIAREALSKAPDDLSLALSVARQYVMIGRTTGDPRYASYAQAALAPWWNLQNPPTDVLVLRATLKQRVHDFDSALKDLALVLQRQPQNAQARLTRATVFQVRGEFERARQECEALNGRTRPVIAMACAQIVESLTGKADQAYLNLKSAVDNTRVDSSVRAWLITGLGEIAERLGNRERAQAHYKEALAVDPEDVYLLGAYADLLLDEQRYREVITLLADKRQSDPLLLRFAIAARRLGLSDAVTAIDQLRSRFDASRMRGDRVHLREEARFQLHVLDDPKKALTIAKQNWAIQKEPADARILLEAARAANEHITIDSLKSWVKQTRLQDAHLESLLRI